MAGTNRTQSPDRAWRDFRAVAIGSPVGWLLAVALFVALVSERFAKLGDPRALTTVMVFATAFYAVLPASMYPWDRRREGSRFVQALLVVLFIAGFLLGYVSLQYASLQRV